MAHLLTGKGPCPNIGGMWPMYGYHTANNQIAKGPLYDKFLFMLRQNPLIILPPRDISPFRYVLQLKVAGGGGGGGWHTEEILSLSLWESEKWCKILYVLYVT